MRFHHSRVWGSAFNRSKVQAEIDPNSTSEAEAPLLGRREVARRFGVSPQTVTRWANEGILPCVRTLGGQRRFLESEVERVSRLHGAGLPLRPLERPSRKQEN
ncbi:MAG: helix-turn-helix domain-containing protein [Dehalococcoidia bacterium]